MERDYQAKTSIFVHPDELDWRTAFHEAGHATAIHFGNQQKQLPPVFFEIQVKRPKNVNDHFFAKVVDGNLIQNLPIAIIESCSILSGCEEHSCQQAYEADIVNLLVGPLAEAKYVAIRDGEIFNLHLINYKALHNYGGNNDLVRVKAYLDSFIASKTKREEKLSELLAQAFRFVEDSRHWRCILDLAHYILDSNQETISCDEAISVFDRSVSSFSHPAGLRRFFLAKCA